MVSSDWLNKDCILLDRAAAGLAGVLSDAAGVLAAASGLDAARVEAALRAVAGESQFALGSGVAVPHVEVPALERPSVALVRVTEPLAIGALDGAPADLFFVILFPENDPSGHLELLAHLARLCQSRVFREGLRGADSPDEVLRLVHAAEARHAASGAWPVVPAPKTDDATQFLAVVSISGERAVDRLLVELLDHQLGNATTLDAQTVREAASREVPLFSGFRDLFGDPGGQRVILALVDSDRTGVVTDIVHRVCEDRGATRAEVLLLPVATRWEWQLAAPEPSGRGH